MLMLANGSKLVAGVLVIITALGALTLTAMIWARRRSR